MKVRYVRVQDEKIEGVTFVEIQAAIPSITKPTFRKWLQLGLLPAPVGYEITGRGRVALYPTDIIEFIKEHTVVAIRWKKRSK